MSDKTPIKPPRFRSLKSHNAYQAEIRAGKLDSSCPLCEQDRVTVMDFTHWRITENRYPYDRIAVTHHLLSPKRHVTDSELSEDELTELKDIRQAKLNQDYTFIMEALPRGRSIPAHFHLHLIVPKEFAKALD